MARGITCCGLLSVLLWPMLSYALPPHEAVRQGNAFYQAGEYGAAARQYATAEQALPEAAEVHFNQGNAAYKRQDYPQALEHYTNALHTAEPLLESRTKYNLGNVQYQQALQAMARPQEAMTHARAAITYYRDSLEVDPQQPEAQYNLELAYRLVQQLQHHLPAPPQQAQQNSLQPPSPSQRQQEQQDRHSQRQQQVQQSQAPPPPQPHSSPPDQPQTAQEAQASQGQQPSQSHTPSDHSEMRQTARPADLLPGEAERLLEMIREHAREAERVRAQWQRTPSRDPRVEKDW